MIRALIIFPVPKVHVGRRRGEKIEPPPQQGRRPGESQLAASILETQTTTPSPREARAVSVLHPQRIREIREAEAAEAKALRLATLELLHILRAGDPDHRAADLRALYPRLRHVRLRKRPPYAGRPPEQLTFDDLVAVRLDPAQGELWGQR